MKKIIKNIFDYVVDNQKKDLSENIKLIKHLLIHEMTTEESIIIIESVKKEFTLLLQERNFDAKNEGRIIDSYFKKSKLIESSNLAKDPIFEKPLSQINVTYEQIKTA